VIVFAVFSLMRRLTREREGADQRRIAGGAS
jgi:hypothetical protein